MKTNFLIKCAAIFVAAILASSSSFAGESRSFQFKLNNKMGHTVVDYRYSIRYEVGNIRAASVEVLPEELNVAWGYAMDVEEYKNGATRFAADGTLVKGVEVKVVAIVSHLTKNRVFSQNFFIDGDGEFIVAE